MAAKKVNMKNFKILDCTLRDGGYYTNWDFKPQTVDKYLKAMEELPIDYIEIGYRNLKQSVYKGEFFYTPLETLKKVKSLTSKLIVLIVDEYLIKKMNNIKLIPF